MTADGGGRRAGRRDRAAYHPTMTSPTSGPVWAPSACTLPTATRPLREAEFADVFREHLRSVERIAPPRLRLGLHRCPSVAATVADLAAREASCCGFFTFTLTVDERRLVLDVETSPGHETVLDDVQRQATAALAP